MLEAFEVFSNYTAMEEMLQIISQFLKMKPT